MISTSAYDPKRSFVLGQPNVRFAPIADVRWQLTAYCSRLSVFRVEFPTLQSHSACYAPKTQLLWMCIQRFLYYVSPWCRPPTRPPPQCDDRASVIGGLSERAGG